MKPETPFAEVMREEGRRQDWLARLLDVKPEQVSRWVNGHIEPAGHTKRAIAAALHVPVSRLWPVHAADATSAPADAAPEQQVAA